MYDWVAHFPFAAGLRFTAKVGELSRQRNLGSLTERPSQADFVTVMYLSFSGFGELKQLSQDFLNNTHMSDTLGMNTLYTAMPRVIPVPWYSFGTLYFFFF